MNMRVHGVRFGPRRLLPAGPDSMPRAGTSSEASGWAFSGGRRPVPRCLRMDAATCAYIVAVCVCTVYTAADVCVCVCVCARARVGMCACACVRVQKLR
jgi:hypothetical protein